jgi:tetratricopeptide (TPR) repeat protein
MKLHSNSPSSSNTTKRKHTPKLKFESTLDAAKVILSHQTDKPIHRLQTTEQFNLATAHYILATQPDDDTYESSEQSAKFHLNSALQHLSHVSKKTKVWRDQIVYTYFKRAELHEQQSDFDQAALDYQQAIRIFQADPTPNPIDIPTDIKLLAIQSAVALADLMLSGEVEHPEFQSQSLAFEYLQFALNGLDLFPELTRVNYFPAIRRRRSRFPFDDMQANQDYIYTCSHTYQLAGLYFSSPLHQGYKPDTAQHYFNRAIQSAYQLLPYGDTTHYLAELYHSLTNWHQLPVHSLSRQASATYYWILTYLFSRNDWPVDPEELDDAPSILMDAEIEYECFKKRCVAISRPIKTNVCRMTLIHFIDGLNFMLGLIDVDVRRHPNQIMLNWLPMSRLKTLLEQLMTQALSELFEYDHPHARSLKFGRPHPQSELISNHSVQLDIERLLYTES